ncbi:hypothetical protein CHARACLAT_017417, partial [Characodon lateralis]|nr:hypothetical protein [Characodon lateralis]
SRSRQEDPEQARLKQKAKEMQQQELAQMRQRDANLTALAAIGPRKKRKLDSPGATPSGTEMPEPPQLAPLDVEEQRLYSEAPHPISKGVPGHPTEEAHFSHLYPGSHSFGHDPKFMAIDDGRNHVICKKNRQNPLVPKPDPFRPLAASRNPVHKSYEQDR